MRRLAFIAVLTVISARPAAAAQGMEALLDALYPQTRGWPAPAEWPILPEQGAIPLGDDLFAALRHDLPPASPWRTVSAAVFADAWNACGARRGCLRRHSASAQHIFFSTGFRDREGQWWALWSKAGGHWRSVTGLDAPLRVQPGPDPAVLFYVNDWHEAAAYFAIKGSGSKDIAGSKTFVPFSLNAAEFVPVSRGIIAVPRFCLTERPGFDRQAGNCAPATALLDNTAGDAPVPDSARLAMIGGAAEPALEDWRFVRLAARYSAAGTTPDHVAGWINLARNPATWPDWHYQGRP